MNNLHRHNALRGKDQRIAFINSLIKSYRITYEAVLLAQDFLHPLVSTISSFS